jgi:hypothetical protein
LLPAFAAVIVPAWANVFTIQHQDGFFLANDLGDLIIAKMSPDGYQELSRAHLIDPTHKVGNRSVYLRNDKELRCYSLSKTVSDDSEGK